MSKDKNRLAGNAIAMVALAVTQRLIGFITVSSLSRIIGPRDLGLIASTQSSAQILYSLGKLGIDNGLLVKISESSFLDDKRLASSILSQVFSIFIFLSIFSFSFLYIFADFIAANVFADSLTINYMRAASVLSALLIFAQFSFCVFTGLRLSKKYAQITGLFSIISFSIVIGAACFLPFDFVIWSIVFGSLISALATFLFLIVKLREIGLYIRLCFPSRSSVNIFFVGFPFYINTIILTPAEFYCIALLMKSAGADAMGNLRVVQSLASVLLLVPAAISALLLADMSSRMAGRADVSPVFAQIKWMWLIAMFIVIPAALLWPFATSVIFGPSFIMASKHGHLILATIVPMTLIGVISNGFMASGRSSYVAVLGVLQIVFIVVLSFLIVNLGLQGYLINQAIYLSAGTFAGFLMFKFLYSYRIERAWIIYLFFWNILFFVFLILPELSVMSGMHWIALGSVLFILFVAGCPVWVISREEAGLVFSRINSLLAKRRRDRES